MKQLGQHPAPRHTVAHLSDPHLLAGDARNRDARGLASSTTSPVNLGEA